MVSPSKVVNFLKIGPNWDPTLLFVLGGSVGFNLIAFQIIHQYMDKPILCKLFPKIDLKLDQEVLIEECGTFETPENYNIDLKLIFGAYFFGIGFGISGLCVGPALLNIFSGSPHVILYATIPLYIGMRFGTFMKRNSNSYIVKPVEHKPTVEKKLRTKFKKQFSGIINEIDTNKES